MTQTQTTEVVNKALALNIVKTQIQVSIGKAEMLGLIQEALKDETAGPSIKRSLAPFLSGAYGGLETYSNVTILDTDEAGITAVSLKQPQVKKVAVVEEDVVEEVEETTVRTEA